MQFENFSRKDISFFGRLANLLGANQESLIPLIDVPFSLENFEKQFQSRQPMSQERRDTLVEVLKKQYQQAQLSVPQSLELLLQQNCYTVCTGHQLNLFTGPLYTIYKIVHVIKLAEQINQIHKNQTVVPVFWMATEDHDLEEINHFFVKDKKISWSTAQSGPVGRMKLENWQDWQTDVLTIFPHHQKQLMQLFEVYQGENLVQATRRLVHHLFVDTPLLILDGDDADLKRQFAPIMRKEIEDSFALLASGESSELLERKGLKSQALVREVNLFYLEEQSRKRLEKTVDGIKIGETLFSEETILKTLDAHPERFSPNVILRPLYQETVLPNLCYVGGAGELAYWLQLKPIFQAAHVDFPLLQLRFSAQIMSNKDYEKMHRLGFQFTDFAQSKAQVLKQRLSSLSRLEEIQGNRAHIVDALREVLVKEAGQIDKTLLATAEAHVVRIEEILKKFDQKVRNAERRKHADMLTRIDELHEQFFPENGLQERFENFIPYFLQNSGNLISELIRGLDSASHEFLVIRCD